MELNIHLNLSTTIISLNKKKNDPDFKIIYNLIIYLRKNRE